MSHSLNRDLKLKLRARLGVLAFYRGQRDHLLQRWRPRAGSRFANLVAILEHGHRNSRGNG